MANSFINNNILAILTSGDCKTPKSLDFRFSNFLISPIKEKVASGIGNQGTQRKGWFLFFVVVLHRFDCHCHHAKQDPFASQSCIGRSAL